MSRINTCLVLMLAFSSICFGATLMQMSMNRSEIDNKGASHGLYLERYSDSSCRQMIKEQRMSILSKVAHELYKRAFSLSFNGNWQEAKAASECAAQLVNGSHKWGIEAKDLVSGVH